MATHESLLRDINTRNITNFLDRVLAFLEENGDEESQQQINEFMAMPRDEASIKAQAYFMTVIYPQLSRRR